MTPESFCSRAHALPGRSLGLLSVTLGIPIDDCDALHHPLLLLVLVMASTPSLLENLQHFLIAAGSFLFCRISCKSYGLKYWYLYLCLVAKKMWEGKEKYLFIQVKRTLTNSVAINTLNTKWTTFHRTAPKTVTKKCCLATFEIGSRFYVPYVWLLKTMY